MQRHPANLVPVYQNGILTWAPAGQAVQAPIIGRQPMETQPLMQQKTPMMEHVAYQNRTMAMGHSVVRSGPYMTHNKPNPVTMMPQQGMLQRQRLLPVADPYGRGMPGLHGTPIQYGGASMQQHDTGMGGGGMTGYSGPGCMVMDPVLSNVGEIGASPIRATPSPTRLCNPMDNSSIPCTPVAMVPNSDIRQDFVSANNLRKLPVGRTMPQPGAGGIMAHDPRVGTGYMHGTYNPTAMGLHVSQDMKQRIDPMNGQQVNLQRMQPLNQYVVHHASMAVHQTPQQHMGLSPVGYPVTKDIDMATQRQMAPTPKINIPSKATLKLPIQGHPQPSEENKALINSGINIARMNAIVKPIAMPSSHEQTNLQQNSVSDRLNRVVSSEKASHSPIRMKMVHDGDEVMHSPKEIMASHDGLIQQPQDSTPKKRRVFAINNKWKLGHHGQRVYFEFDISEAGYRQLLSFIDGLSAPTAVRDASDKKGLQIFERDDSKVVTYDSLKLVSDGISDAVLLKIIEKLKSLRSSIVKKGDRRKLIRRDYAERNCVVLSNFKSHELRCFFGTTIVEDNLKLALYHRLKCDDNPNFICGRETRKFKAAVERQYDLYLELPGYGIKVVLCKLADAHEKTCKVAFGARSHDVVDLIMYIFNKPPQA